MQHIKSLSTQKHKHEEATKRQSSYHAKEILSQPNEHQKEIQRQETSNRRIRQPWQADPDQLRAEQRPGGAYRSS